MYNPIMFSFAKQSKITKIDFTEQHYINMNFNNIIISSTAEGESK